MMNNTLGRDSSARQNDAASPIKKTTSENVIARECLTRFILVANPRDGEMCRREEGTSATREKAPEPRGAKGYLHAYLMTNA